MHTSLVIFFLLQLLSRNWLISLFELCNFKLLLIFGFFKCCLSSIPVLIELHMHVMFILSSFINSLGGHSMYLQLVCIKKTKRFWLCPELHMINLGVLFILVRHEYMKTLAENNFTYVQFGCSGPSPCWGAWDAFEFEITLVIYNTPSDYTFVRCIPC